MARLRIELEDVEVAAIKAMPMGSSLIIGRYNFTKRPVQRDRTVIEIVLHHKGQNLVELGYINGEKVESYKAIEVIR